MAAHAVAHDIEAEFGVDEVGVFVAFAPESDVGACDSFGGL